MQRIKRLRRIEPEPQGRQHRVIRVSGILMEIERERHLGAIGRAAGHCLRSNRRGGDEP